MPIDVGLVIGAFVLVAGIVLGAWSDASNDRSRTAETIRR